MAVPAMLVGERLGILAWLKSHFAARRGVSLTAESIPESGVPLELERARLARELHDGAVSSMIAADMRLDVLRRKLLAQASPLASEVEDMQQHIREEWLKLRALMREDFHLKP